MLFGHWLQLLGLMLLGLLIFGPRRMIEMGSAFGKAFREFREATKELSWPGLGESQEATPPASTLSRLSQISQTLGGANGSAPATNVQPPPAQVVESAPAPPEAPPN
jgi:Sec-independent protein translocase protein TatA